MDVDGEQQQASAAAKKLKHLKDKVVPGECGQAHACNNCARPSYDSCISLHAPACVTSSTTVKSLDTPNQQSTMLLRFPLCRRRV